MDFISDFLNINFSHNIAMLFYHICLTILYYYHIVLAYLFQYVIILFIFAAGMAVYNSILFMYLTEHY